MNKLFILTITLLSLLCPSLINGQSSSFTFQSSNGTFCTPTTINFTQTYSGSPIGFSWNFGNGQTSNNTNPSIIYSNPGTYTVQLVTVYDDVALETSQTITINQSITSTLSADRNYICTPGNILFTATTTGNIGSYLWDFGDGNIITNNSPTINHVYSSFGNFIATVKATDVSGCFVISTTDILVQKPTITGSVSPIKGCIPINVNFTANVSLPSGGNVTSYSYDYGDGSPISNIALHTYTTVGSFIPSVTITTNEGCTNTFIYPKVAFGTPPTNHVAFPSKNVYCGSETAVLTSRSNNANSWLWNFGDGNMQTVIDSVTNHKYSTLGIKTLTVTPYFNGCAGTPKSFSINIVGVIAGFNYANTCGDKKTFSFTNISQGNQSVISWNFGDGSPPSSVSNPTHSFPSSGSFTTTLSISDAITGCMDMISNTIYTAGPSLINSDSFVCRNSTTSFSIQNNYNNPSASYTWNVLGLPNVTNFTSTYIPKAMVFGNFNNNNVLLSNGTQYCSDTLFLSHLISVRGPKLNFATSSARCANTNYNIINMSSSYSPADTILFSYWNYGITPKNDTTFQPSLIKFPSSGLYNIKFFAKDNNGCTDSLIKQIDVKPIPFLRIFPRNDTLCEGQSVTLIAYHSDTLMWRPAPTLVCITCDTVSVSPTVTTVFYATANNSFNCPTTDSTVIKVYSPFVATPLINPVYLCFKDSTKLVVFPSGKKITWSPSTNISNTTIYNPFVSPPNNTTYTASLTDSAGCYSSTTSIDIILKSLPQVDAGLDKVYPYNSMFTISPVYSSNVTSYSWTPVALLNCNTCPITSGIALASQIFTIKATSDSGCIAKDNIKIFVECKYANIFMPSAFSPNRDGLNDLYFPLTRGIKAVKRFTIYNRYGQQVYEAKNFVPNDKSFGWNGKTNGIDQPGGAYVYMLETICDLGDIISKKDSFLLLR